MTTDIDHILKLAEIIREVDGGNRLGAAALAEAILSHPGSGWSPAVEPEGLTDEELMAVTPMDYETYISIQQYSSDSDYFYNLKVTNAMNEDYYYTGTVSTLGDVMLCIKHHLEEHTTTETP